jgi:hypothetical protein
VVCRGRTPVTLAWRGAMEAHADATMIKPAAPASGMTWRTTGPDDRRPGSERAEPGADLPPRMAEMFIIFPLPVIRGRCRIVSDAALRSAPVTRGGLPRLEGLPWHASPGFNAPGVPRGAFAPDEVFVRRPHRTCTLLHPLLDTCRQQLADAGIRPKLRTVLADSGYVSEDNFARADTGGLRRLAPLAKTPDRQRPALRNGPGTWTGSRPPPALGAGAGRCSRALAPAQRAWSGT